MTTIAPLRIAIAGLGTVGAGVIRLLDTNAALIAARAGRPIEVVAVAARDRGKDRGVNIARFAWEDDMTALARRDDVDVVVELVGGSDGPALALSRAALGAGKGLVTANKAMIAHHGLELAELAEGANAALKFEAAVAGGIPVIKGLREGTSANALTKVYGILNGTCNYILSEMEATGADFADVLAEAQRLGFAEADPAFDIEGVDAAHKLAHPRAGGRHCAGRCAGLRDPPDRRGGRGGEPRRPPPAPARAAVSGRQGPPALRGRWPHQRRGGRGQFLRPAVVSGRGRG